MKLQTGINSEYPVLSLTLISHEPDKDLVPVKLASMFLIALIA
jgi:hypothetical protein